MRIGFLALVVMITPAWAGQSYMVGTWFGTGQPHERSSMYIDRMRPDGSWRGEYRTCVKGKSEDLTQEGRWSLNGDLLTLRVDKVDGATMPRTDTYRVLQHSPTAQKYIELPMKFAYAPQRVADNFAMPSCQLVG